MPLADIELELRMPGLKARHAEVSQQLIYLQLAWFMLSWLGVFLPAPLCGTTILFYFYFRFKKCVSNCR